MNLCGGVRRGGESSPGCGAVGIFDLGLLGLELRKFVAGKETTSFTQPFRYGLLYSC